MSRRSVRLVAAPVAAVGLACALAGSARAQQDQAVLSGIQYLRGRAAHLQVGETAMIALALVKAGTPASDPVLSQCMTKILKRFTSSGYEPERSGGHDIYEAAVMAMLLANLESEDSRAPLGLVAGYILGKQNPNGSWDYAVRTQGDTSISQYAILGLWEAESAGVEVPPSVWDKAAGWFLSVQAKAGSWNYHRDESMRYADSLSMTAAGVGSLLICRRQLDGFKKSRQGISSLLTNLTPEGSNQDYKVATSMVKVADVVKGGMAWLGANFTTSNSPVVGQSIYYGLYGVERIGALADRQTIGRVDWYEKGRSFLHQSQRPDGSWHYSLQTDEMNTVWAILFLTRSTQKSIQRRIARKLGAGTLVGGRNLPKDLTSITVAGGRIMSRPMNGAVEGMLAVLEDPRSESADTAVAGLIDRYQREGPGVLRPFKDRFRKMITDRDPGVRSVAAWALSRTGDLDVVLTLIDALVDPDEGVVISAKLGLQLLSRKIDGLGPPSPSTPEERAEAVRKWRAWYETVRPLEPEIGDSKENRPVGRSTLESRPVPSRSPSP
jgi:hypothetical protein